ncbi:SDH family Clp fold serine proteinase [Egbenema bharatensis]|uniref:SDH family Clp fold serine proteinase n=1 Tax=Egbenema bharatensis TaxID=3463334 RepID=UPI003A842705
MNFSDLFWIFLVIISIQPILQKRAVQSQRIKAIQTFERKRGSRVILMIHRQESVSL